MSLLNGQSRVQTYGRINNNLYSSTTPLTESRSTFSRSKCVFVGVLIVVAVVVIIGGVIFATRHRKKAAGTLINPQYISSKLGKFKNTAVVSDSEPCSFIGFEMLKRNGTAIDAAIASLFCMGVYTGQSMGIGGGFFMTIYNRTTQNATVVDARETAPSASTEDMFKSNETLASRGGMSVAVPGELRGYYEAHKRFGRLPWADLIEPSIKLCKKGFRVGIHLDRTLRNLKEDISNEPTLREIFIDPSTNQLKKKGDIVIRSKLGETLEIIANNGVDEFYNGSVGEKFVEDVSNYGGQLTMDDLRNYTVKIKPAISVSLKNGLKLYSVPPPGSGAVLGFILKILDGYNFNNHSLSTFGNSSLTYHRITEAFKYGYGKRTHLGDEDFVNVTQELDDLLSAEKAEDIRKQIWDNQTFHDYQHYGAYFQKDDKGTAHLSIIDANGDAVSVTSTINYWFGARFRSKSTGIIPNNEMDDFSAPHIVNMFGLPPSPANFIKPGKRPLSSMCPSVIVDANGNAVMVIGGAGGSKITSAIALVILNVLSFGQDIKFAIDSPRIHHQLVPDEIQHEPGFSQDILNGLKALGHNITKIGNFGSVIVGIHQRSLGEIYANYDYRKGGSFAGD